MNFTTKPLIRVALAALVALPLVSCETTVVHPTEYKTIHRYVSVDSTETKSIDETKREEGQITYKSASRTAVDLALLKK